MGAVKTVRGTAHSPRLTQPGGESQGGERKGKEPSPTLETVYAHPCLGTSEEMGRCGAVCPPLDS